MNDREGKREYMKDIMAQGLTIDQYKKFSEMIDSMSDSEFDAFLDKCANSYTDGQLKEKIKNPADAVIKLREAMGVTKENSAMNIVKFNPLSKEENKEMWDKVYNSGGSSDIININWQTDDEICQLCELSESSKDFGALPSDIFFSKTISLRDITVAVNLSGNGEINEDMPEKFKTVTFRVCVFEDYSKIVDDILNKQSSDIVGCLIVNIVDTYVLMPIAISYGMNIVGTTGVGFKDYRYANKMLTNEMSVQNIMNFFGSCYQTWYGIQVAMLHPTMKTVFQRGNRKKRRQADPLRKTTSEVKATKYVKYNIIKTGELTEEGNKAIKTEGEEKRTIHRKKMCWYVCGHWRKSNNDAGKTFVQGYWKGPLRKLKMADPERLREVDLTEAQKSMN